MPFPVLNYMYGTTGVEFQTYVAATALGLCPGTFMYVYTGHALRSLVDLLSGDPKALGLQYQILFVVGVVMTVLVSIYLANEARIVGSIPRVDSAENVAVDLELGEKGEMAAPGSLTTPARRPSDS